MNYIQFCYNLFPTKIFKEDREEYISALRQSQEEEVNQPFLDFMAAQLKKSLSLEIERFDASQKKKFSFMFLLESLHFRTAAARGHQIDSSENQQHGYGLRAIERV